MKKVLVTGATGFIGNYVILELLKDNYSVIATSSLPEKAKNFSWFSKVQYIPFNLESFDNNINYFTFFEKPQAVIHLAWEGLPNYKASFHLDINFPRHFSFLRNMLQNGLTDITVTGTCFEYGMREGSLSEEMPSAPANPYAFAKDMLRRSLEELQFENNFHFKWIRLFYMYGDGQNPNSLLSQLDKALAEGSEMFNMSGGEQLRDYLPVEQVASNIVEVMNQNKIEGIINCCSAKPISVKQIVENRLHNKKATISLNLGYYAYTDYEPMAFWGNNFKLNKILTKMNFKDNFSSTVENLSLVFKQSKVPIFQNKVYSTEKEALLAEVADVELVQSDISGFIFNNSFNPEIMHYDENYQNEQGTSVIFQKHLVHVLELLKSFGVANKKVVEIGCGKGVFFDLMLKEDIDCWGFDPTYEGSNPRIIKEYFSKKYTDINADVIILRHTLEHIPKPFSFIHTIAQANNNKGYLFIEVPTFDWIFNKNAFWDVFYEHCNYFTEESLAVMFDEGETGPLFEGQYIYLWANLEKLKETIPCGVNFTKRNSLNFDNKINEYKKNLNQATPFAIWGAGAKGSTFLNLLDKEKKLVKYVIDINPAKQNKFIAGTGHPIFSPDILLKRPVENILIMNENYIDEIKQLINTYNITANISSL